MIYHYFFINHAFKFQDYTCNDCHDLTMLSVNMSNIAIITIKNVDYRCMITLANIISVYSRQFFFTFSFSIYKVVDIMDLWTSVSL